MTDTDKLAEIRQRHAGGCAGDYGNWPMYQDIGTLLSIIGRLRAALTAIAYEPMGHPEASSASVIAEIVELAREAIGITEELQ